MALYAIDCSHPVRFITAGFLRDTSHMHIERRSLESTEVFVIERGVLHIEADGVKAAAGKGTILLHPRGTHQRGYAPSPGSLKYIWFHFSAAISPVAHTGAGIAPLKKLLHLPRDLYGHGGGSSSTIVIPGLHVANRFIDLLRVANLIAEKRLMFSNEKDHLIAAFLYLLSADYLERSAMPGGVKPAPAASIARNWLDNHLDNQLQMKQVSVGRVADQLEMNPDYLNRIFKKSYGLRISEYILDRRIEAAHHWLSEGMSVKEAARLSGFANPKYFAQAFKRETGVSPSEFKRNSVGQSLR